MYYMYEGNRYKKAEIEFESSAIGLSVSQSINTRATACGLMAGLFKNLIYLNMKKGVKTTASHYLMLLQFIKSAIVKSLSGSYDPNL